SWDFGDGQTATGQAVQHNYGQDGSHTVSVTVSGDYGTDTDSGTIAIANLPPTIDGTTIPVSATEGDVLSFSATASDPAAGDLPLTYTWKFGDGTQLTGDSVSHTYDDDDDYTVTLTVADDDTTVVEKHTVSIANAIPVVITAGPTTGTEEVAVVFSAVWSDAGAADSHVMLWDLGDGTTSGLPDFSHTYMDSGDYDVSLTVIDDDGGIGNSTFIIAVANTNPTINSSSAPSAGNEGQQLSFSASASDVAADTVSYLWDFGDGNTANSANIDYTYPQDGDYTATLTVSDEDGGQTIETFDVDIANVAPTIDSTSVPSSADEGELLSFSVTTTEPAAGDIPLTIHWDFGNGDEGVGSSVSYTYPDDGSFTVVLTVSDDDATVQETFPLQVDNLSPILQTTDIPANCNEGDSLTFYAQAQDIDALTYEWDFGNGDCDWGSTVPYTYLDNGTFTVELNISDGTEIITVTQTLEVANVAPVITTNGPTTGTEGQLVEFTIAFSDAGAADTHTNSWDFGDGNSTDKANPDHTYAAPGLYPVTLTVTDDDGGVGSNTFTVDIANAPPAIVDATVPESGVEGEELTFSAVVSDYGGGNVEYVWDFGDGSDADTATANHVYHQDGSYNVILTATDDDGATTTESFTVQIANVAPTIEAATVVPATGVEGELLTLSAVATDPGTDILSYLWDFGTGDTAPGPTVEYTWPDDGNYTIRLTVFDDDSSVYQDFPLEISNAAPQISLFEVPATGDEGQSIVFSAEATDPGLYDIVSYIWDFGDGTTETGMSPSHVYDDNAQYLVTFTAFDGEGGVATNTGTIDIGNLPPTVVVTGDIDDSMGTTLSWAALVADPGADDTHVFNWDYGDGETGPGASHTYSKNGIFEVTISVSDDDGGVGTDSIVVFISTFPGPTVDDVSGPQLAFEGDLLSFACAGTDVNGTGSLTYEWDFGD
ncbi:MAG: PKD domain-containing protein, partial [Proteobacteria bacterium]|nr:PKD domain-containing protein [Pseudomonadota bacterium]